MDDKFIDVGTGEVAVSSQAVVLRVMAIGSCVVVIAYDRDRKIGGMAHIMLPGRALRKGSVDRAKYTEDAIDIFLVQTTGWFVSREWVKGWYRHSPLWASNVYFYPIWKE